MEKEKLFAAIVAVVLVLGTVGFSLSSPSGTPDIIFLSSRIDPASATPGGNLEFNVITQNWATIPADNAVLRITLPDDLILKDSEMKEISVGKVCSLCNFETKYSLKVSEKAVSGEYRIKILLSWDGGSRERDFVVSVSGTPKVVITNISYSPEKVEPGESTAVTLTVKNIGGAPALNGALGLTIPTLTGDTKQRFSIIGSGTELAIGTLSVGESKTIVFELAADDNVEAGVYNFPATLSYSGTGSSTGIGLVVVSRAELTLPKVQTDPVTVKPDKPFLLSATVENSGKNEAKSAKVRFVIDDPRFSGTKSAYLGTIKSGDKDVALFEMTYAGPVLSKKDIPVAFEVTYVDDFGEHSFTESGEITVDAGISTDGGINQIAIGALVLAIAVVILFVFFRKKRGPPSGKRV